MNSTPIDAFNVESSIEIHLPMLEAIGQDRLLDLSPSDDKIYQNLRLNGRPAPELNGIGAELNRPFGDAPAGFFVMENVTEREFGDDDDLVIFEIMAELVGCNQDCVQQLLDLGIPSLGLVQDLADEVNRSLDLVRMPSLLALNDNSRADNSGGRSDVNQ
jgi:hypothetical protein